MRTNSRGAVLVVVLWTIAIMATMAIHLSSSTRAQVHVYKKLGDRDIFRHAVEAPLLAFADHFRRRESMIPFTLGESHRGGGGLVRGSLGSLKFALTPLDGDQNYLETSKANQEPIDLNLSDQSQAYYGIIDESRKVNINVSSAFVLKQLIEIRTGIKPEEAGLIANSILDYRDKDDIVHSKEKFVGSEQSIYQMAGLKYTPKNGNFEYVSELLQVLGMTEQIYSRLREYLTVLGSGQINVNTAPRDVLLAIDLNEKLVDKIIRLRPGGDGSIGTADDIAFKHLAHIEAKLSAAFELSESERISLRHAISRRLLTVSSEYFKVSGYITNNQSQAFAHCIYSRKGGIQFWLET